MELIKNLQNKHLEKTYPISLDSVTNIFFYIHMRRENIGNVSCTI